MYINTKNIHGDIMGSLFGQEWVTRSTCVTHSGLITEPIALQEPGEFRTRSGKQEP